MPGGGASSVLAPRHLAAGTLPAGAGSGTHLLLVVGPYCHGKVSSPFSSFWLFLPLPPFWRFLPFPFGHCHVWLCLPVSPFWLLSPLS